MEQVKEKKNPKEENEDKKEQEKWENKQKDDLYVSNNTF